jgi:hypothetical protein
MKFEIDDDIVDKMVLKTLKDDYISQQTEIRRLKNCPGPLKDFEYEDMHNAFELSDALEVLLKYYIYRPDAEAWIREHSVRKRS